jgi:alpha-ribazole phosphatase
MKLTLVRHTRVAVAPGTCYGRSDVPVAASFSEEFTQLRTRLSWAPTVIWSSPATRCLQLAQAWAAPHTALHVDARLQELHFGEWEGKRWDDFDSLTSRAWALDPWNLRPPGGETAHEMWLRIGSLRDQAHRLEADARLLVVTHAGVIRMWCAMHAGQPPGPSVLAREVGYGLTWELFDSEVLHSP